MMRRTSSSYPVDQNELLTNKYCNNNMALEIAKDYRLIRAIVKFQILTYM